MEIIEKLTHDEVRHTTQRLLDQSWTSPKWAPQDGYPVDGANTALPEAVLVLFLSEFDTMKMCLCGTIVVSMFFFYGVCYDFQYNSVYLSGNVIMLDFGTGTNGKDPCFQVTRPVDITHMHREGGKRRLIANYPQQERGKS